jgi:1,4-alpha-glucan branching enzyme
MNEIAKGNKNANDIESYFKKNKLSYPKDDYRMYFTSNHDENSWKGTEFERMGDAAETFAALSAIVPGMPLIYSGQEAALNKRLEFFEKDTIDWKNYELADFYTRLLNLKKNNKALWNGKQGGNMIRVRTSNDKAVFAFVRIKDNDKVFAIFNLTDQEQIINLKCKYFVGDYTDVFTGQKTSFAKGESVNLKPWEFMVMINLYPAMNDNN